MCEKTNFSYRVIFVLLAVLILVFAGVGFYAGYSVFKPRDTEHIGRDDEYGRQMGRVTELIGSVDRGLAGVQDGLARIKFYIGQDAGNLRDFATRLRDIAGEVGEMENSIHHARDSISGFLADDDSGSVIELGE